MVQKARRAKEYACLTQIVPKYSEIIAKKNEFKC
jgi:hypothetical protein